MTKTASDLMTETLAKIDQVFNIDYRAAKEREATDPVLARLKLHAISLHLPITKGGLEGLAQVVESVSDTARNWRQQRVTSLQLARKHRINGQPNASKAWLKKAAAQRREETRCRYFETSMAAMAAIDGALAALAEPVGFHLEAAE